MTSVSGVVFAASPVAASAPSSGPVSVATALASLRLRPGSTVEVSDTAANIQRNLEALQRLAGRVTSLAATDADPQLTVNAAQYDKFAGILAKWGATAGQTVEVTGIAAANAAAFAAARASWVETFTVADSSANLARNLDGLQTLVAAGSLRQIVHTGPATPLKITAAQLAADADALAAIKNQAYTLAITEASVSDTLGLDGQDALTANARVKFVHVKDTTAAIEDHLDALQQAGLKLKSISQTDSSTALTLTARQLTTDAIAIGKILTPYQLDVIRASAAQVAKLAANAKVATVSVADTAANLSRRWALLDKLSDSLAAVEVTDSSNPIALSADQLALNDGVLAKFTVDAEHDYSLAISGAQAGQAATIAARAHVASVAVTDTADNVAASLADLKAVAADGLLQGITITGKSLALSLDAAQMLGDNAADTQGVLALIGNRNWGVAVDGAAVADLDTLAANTRVVSIAVDATSNEIEASLDTLAQLAGRLARVDQTDGGTALDLTLAQFENRAGVLGKIDGGYSVNVTAANAAKALSTALNGHVASVAVTDTGRNLAVHWRALRSIGSSLSGVTKSDAGALSLSAANYLLGVNDGLVARFAADQTFALTAASVDESLQLAADDAVTRIDLVDDGSAVTAKITDLATLATGGKLQSVVLSATTTRLALGASQLDGAQGVLDLVKDGRYTLALDGVDIAGLADLLSANTKIATVKVTADAAGIADHLADLAGAGHKLLTITRTDAPDTALALTGTDYATNRSTLAKIAGGYSVDLSEVAAARAAGFAATAQVKSLQVADTGANLAATWNALAAIGAKLTEVAQSDSAAIALSSTQWAASHALGAKFSSTLGLAISGATVSELATLSADDAVLEIGLADFADAVSAAWSDLGAESKLTQIRISDPTTALTMSADTYAASTDLLGKIAGGQYTLSLAGVAVADAATLDADTHVADYDVTGSSEDIAAAFDTLGGLTKLGTLALSDDGGTLTLSAAQVLAGAATLAKIGNGYQLAATAATLADLPDLQAVENLASVTVTDSAANLATQLDDLVALGSLLTSIHPSDATPVLALTQQDWNDGAAALAKIDTAYQVDLTAVDPAAAETLSAESTVRQLSVSGTAGSIVQAWSALVAAYADGSGKLTAVALTDESPLTLTEAQQTDGAALITALLADETIVTVG